MRIHPFKFKTGFKQLWFIFLVALKKIKQMANAQALIKIQSVFLIVLATWLWGFSGFIYTTIAAYMFGLSAINMACGFEVL